MRKTLLVAVGVLAVCSTCVMPAHAAGIGVNFAGDSLNGPGWFLSPTDQPGIAGGANWNNAPGGSGTGFSLQDHNAAPTTALLTWSAIGAYDAFGIPNTGNAARDLMYSGGLFGNPSPNEISISVTNIPYALYNVYVYASQDTDDTSELSITLTGSTTTTFYYASDGNTNSGATSLLLTTSTTPGSPTTGPAQYKLFTGLTGSSFSLDTFGSAENVLSNNVFGLQIVDATVPEPSSWLTIASAMGLFGFSLRRRPR